MAPFDPYNFTLKTKGYPEQLPAYIEVSAGSRNKYEWDQEVGALMLDRVLHSAVHYPNE
jgi:inorganic pyrophosphatase